MCPAWKFDLSLQKLSVTLFHYTVSPNTLVLGQSHFCRQPTSSERVVSKDSTQSILSCVSQSLCYNSHIIKNCYNIKFSQFFDNRIRYLNYFWGSGSSLIPFLISKISWRNFNLKELLLSTNPVKRHHFIFQAIAVIIMNSLLKTFNSPLSILKLK